MKNQPKKKVTIGATPSKDVVTEVKTVVVNPVIPAAFVGHDPALTPENLSEAIALGEKHPDIVTAVEALRSSLDVLSEAAKVAGSKYYDTAKALRNSKLVRHEATLLLKGLGFSKVTASKLQKVAEVSPEVWAKYEAKELGFNATLLLGRKELATDVVTAEPTKPGEPATATTTPNPADETTAPRKPKEDTPFPKKYIDRIAALLVEMGEDGMRASKDGMPYFFQYETSQKVKYQLTVKVL